MIMFNRTNLYGSKRINNFRDFVKVTKKNHNLNKNINNFIKNYSQNLPIREKKLKPEVIITSYKQGKFVEMAIQSVLAAKKNIDITVTDDGSPDNSQKIIKNLQSKYSFKFIPNTQNTGGYPAYNIAIEKSKNNLMIILNADDMLTRYSINTIIDIFKKTKVRMVGGTSINFTNDNLYNLNNNFPKKLNYLPKGKIYGPKNAAKFKRLNEISMTASSSSFLKSAWEAVGGFWEFERRVCAVTDRDFEMRVCALFDVMILEEPLAFYRINENPFTYITNKQEKP